MTLVLICARLGHCNIHRSGLFSKLLSLAKATSFYVELTRGETRTPRVIKDTDSRTKRQNEMRLESNTIKTGSGSDISQGNGKNYWRQRENKYWMQGVVNDNLLKNLILIEHKY